MNRVKFPRIPPAVLALLLLPHVAHALEQEPYVEDAARSGSFPIAQNKRVTPQQMEAEFIPGTTWLGRAETMEGL